MTPEDRDEAYYPECGHELMDAEWRAFQAIPDQGFSRRAWVDAKIGQRVQAVTADRDMWRSAREEALDEMERAEDTRDAIMADLRKERARIKAVRDVHWADKALNGHTCAEDSHDWPCPTIRALDA